MKTCIAYISVAALAAVVWCLSERPEAEKPQLPGRLSWETVRMNGYCPATDQGRGQLDWALAMAAAVETERIGLGDSVSVSGEWLARRLLMEEDLPAHYFTGGSWPLSMRGTAADALWALERYGAVPRECGQTDPPADTRALTRELRQIAGAAIRSGRGMGPYMGRAERIVERRMGPEARQCYLYGARYTPEEYGRSVAGGTRWEAMTSLGCSAWDAAVVPALKDNWRRRTFLNVRIDTLVSRLRRAVMGGHGAVWEGSVDKEGCDLRRGVADCPAALGSDAARLRAYSRYELTAGHAMSVVGLARSGDGRLWYVMKDSRGTGWGFGGLVYVSEEYVRAWTAVAVVPRNGSGG